MQKYGEEKIEIVQCIILTQVGDAVYTDSFSSICITKRFGLIFIVHLSCEI